MLLLQRCCDYLDRNHYNAGLIMGLWSPSWYSVNKLMVLIPKCFFFFFSVACKHSSFIWQDMTSVVSQKCTKITSVLDSLTL